MRLIIIRGVAGSGKSTLAENLRPHFPKKTAVIHTTLFYWEIVNGDSPEVALENAYLLTKNYLKNGYTVILEGTLYKKDSKGIYWADKFEKLGKTQKAKVDRIFLTASSHKLIQRERKRKKISLAKLQEFRKKILPTLSEKDALIDTTALSPKAVLRKTLSILSK